MSTDLRIKPLSIIHTHIKKPLPEKENQAQFAQRVRSAVNAVAQQSTTLSSSKPSLKRKEAPVELVYAKPVKQGKSQSKDAPASSSSSASAPKTDDAEVIATLFKQQAPSVVLEALPARNFPAIDECHCVPQFSRPKPSEGVKDLRKYAEDMLSVKIAEKFPKKDHPLTICSVASANGFQDLEFLTRIRALGYQNINWILVDPFYVTEEGKKTLREFQQIASKICPGIKFQVLAGVAQLPKTQLIGRPNVVLVMDVGFLGQTPQEHTQNITFLENYIQSSPYPTLYLSSFKIADGVAFDKEQDDVVDKVRAVVSLHYFSAHREIEHRSEEAIAPAPNYLHENHLSFEEFIEILNQDDYRATARCILSFGLDPDRRLDDGSTLLMLMAKNGKFNSLKALVETGEVDVNAVAPDGCTALHTCCNSKEIVSYLISKGANINAQTKEGYTPLHCALLQHFDDSSRTLLRKGARIDIRNVHKIAAKDLLCNPRYAVPLSYSKKAVSSSKK